MMKKRILPVLMVIVMLLPLIAFNTAAQTTKQISYTSPAIPVNTGETVTLSDYSFAGKTATTALADYTWSSDDCTVADGKVTVTEKGVYRLVGTKDSTEIVIFIVAKNSSETEYVLYEEDFTDFDVSEYEFVTGNGSVADGRLKLTNGTRVLLPEYLGYFGDYKIEAIATIKTAVNASRWFSLMYRIQNNNYPYYQMCVRQDATATNGVEFAERTVANAWSVTMTGSFSEAISANKDYKFTVTAKGSVVTESIDDEVIIFNSNANLYDIGRIGLQTDSCTAEYDSVKVTLQLEAPAKPASNSAYADARESTSNIATTPSLVSYINTQEDYDNILTDSPATAIARLNSEGKIVDSDGKELGDIDDYVKKLDKKVIAGFLPADKAAIDILTTYMRTNKFTDVTVLSDDESLLEYANGKYYMVRTMLIITEEYMADKSLMDVRRAVNESGSKTAVLTGKLVTKDNVQYLQKLLITVWAASDGDEDVTEAMKLILSGANGIVAQNRNTVEKCFTEFFNEDSFTRTIWTIGHRGVPSLAPENTIEGSILAAENGSNIIENDIYLTTDGKIVVLHDGTTDRTTISTTVPHGNIENMTLEQVKTFQIKDSSGRDSGYKIPTLEEYFIAFKNTDTFIFVEIKSGKPALVTELVRLVEEYDIADQVCVISFNADQCKRVNQQAPNISTGYLCSGVTASTDDIESVEKALSYVLQYNTTFNQSYNGITAEIVTELQNRGVTLWPWTFAGDANLLLTYYLYGTHGLTTNNSQQLKDTIQFIYENNNSYSFNLAAGAVQTLDLRLKTYSDSVYALPAGNIVMVSGDDVISIDDNKITALKEGTASFFCTYETRVNGKKIYVTSDLFTVTVGQANPETSGGDSSVGELASPNLRWVWVVAGLAVVIAVVAIVIISKKKK